MPDKYKVSKQTLADYSATISAKPNLTQAEIFQKFPEFNNDVKFLQSATDYHATLSSGKYKSEQEVDSKFPEFEFIEKKNQVGNVLPPTSKPVAEPLGNGLSNTQTDKNTEIPVVSLTEEEAAPKVSKYDFDPNSDPISLAKKAKELEGLGKTNVQPSSMGATTSFTPDNDAVGTSKEIKDYLKEQKIDADFINRSLEGLPKEITDDPKKNAQYNDLLQNNPAGYETQVAHDKYKPSVVSKITKLYNEAKSSGDLVKRQETYDDYNFINNVPSVIANSKNNDEARAAIKKGVELVRKYSDNPEAAQKNFSIEASMYYGGNLLYNEHEYKNSPLATVQGLSTNQIAALQFIQDTQPEKYNQYKALLIDKSKVPTDYETQYGIEEKALKLEQVGINLKYNAAIDEKYNLEKKVEAINNGTVQVTPEEANLLNQKLEKNKADFASIDADKQNIINGSKYLRVQRNDANLFANELLGEEQSYGEWAAKETGKAVSNTVEGTYDLVTSPLMSDDANSLRQAQLLGEGALGQEMTELPQSKQMMQSFKPVISTELKSQVDAIKSDKTLTDEQKHSKVSDLLMNNPTMWHREGIEGGKSNVGLKSMVYGVTQLAANLAPFIAITAATGGEGGVARFTKEFAAAATTGFDDAYTAAVKNGDTNPYATAMRVTAINSAAMAGAGTASEIRQMVSKSASPAIDKLIGKLSDNEIMAALRQEPKSISTIRKAYNIGKGIGGKMADNVGGAAKITAFTTAGQVLNQAISGEDVDLVETGKHGMIELLKFGVFGSAGAVLQGLKSEPSEMTKMALYDAATNSESYLEALKKKVEDRAILSTDAEQIKNNIELAKKVMDNVPMVNAKGKELTDVEKRQMLILKMKEQDIDNVLKKDIPKELATKLGDRINNIHEDIDKIYKGTFLKEQAQKPITKETQGTYGIDKETIGVEPTIESAVIEIGGKTYEGKNHAEAILKAKADGQDISNVDRKGQGKFKLSDGTIIDRAEAKSKFGQDRAELLIEQDENAKQADKEYAKITKPISTEEVSIAETKPTETLQKAESVVAKLTKSEIDALEKEINERDSISSSSVGGEGNKENITTKIGGREVSYTKDEINQINEIEKRLPTKMEGDRDVNWHQRYKEELVVYKSVLQRHLNEIKAEADQPKEQPLAVEAPTTSETKKAEEGSVGVVDVESRSNTPIAIKKYNPNGNNEVLTGEDAVLAEARIEKMISTSKTVEEAKQRIGTNAANYVFSFGNETHQLNKFIQDRIDGKTKTSFAEWRKGKAVEQPIKETTKVGSVGVVDVKWWLEEGADVEKMTDAQFEERVLSNKLDDFDQQLRKSYKNRVKAEENKGKYDNEDWGKFENKGEEQKVTESLPKYIDGHYEVTISDGTKRLVKARTKTDAEQKVWNEKGFRQSGKYTVSTNKAEYVNYPSLAKAKQKSIQKGDELFSDENGKPITFYHGTDKEFSEFKPSENKYEWKGIFFAFDKDYAKWRNNKRIVEAKLAVKNPLDVTMSEADWAKIPQDIKDAVKKQDIEFLKSKGYDAVILKKPLGKEIVVFDKSQIKEQSLKETPQSKVVAPKVVEGSVGVGGDVKVNKKLALENAEKIDKGNGSHVKNMSMQELKELASDMVTNEKEYQDKFDDAQGIYNLTTERIEELEQSLKETAKAETPTPKGNTSNGGGDEGSGGVGGDKNAWGSDKGLTENFYTTDVDGYAIKKPITNPSSVTIDGIDFHIAKIDGDWKVIEKKSGLEISTGKTSNTKSAAIEDATMRLAQNGGAKNLPILIDRAIQGFKDRNAEAVEQSLKETPKVEVVKESESVNAPIEEVVEVKEGFTEGKDLNKIYSDLKGKYGDKKGSALYEAANRLVNPNKNTIVEIRGNGVVVKEGGKYLLKPFGNTDANSKKWTLYKGIDISDQFKTEIPKEEVHPEIKTEIENGNITEQQVNDFAANNKPTESEPTVKSIESKAESENEIELNEAIKEADAFIESQSKPKSETEGEGNATSGGIDGTEPPKTEAKAEGEGDKFKDKGILNRLYKAENISEQAKVGFEEKGLKYKTSNQSEAETVAKSIIDEYGIEDAISLADMQKFDGDVNSLIYAESLNRISKLELDAKTSEEKLQYAKQFAEIGIKYDEAARKGGKFNAAINYFYKKSPLGIKMIEEAKRQAHFEEFSKNKNQSWKEFFNELVKEPEFEKIFKEEVREELKKERAESRADRKQKVHDIIDKAKDQFKGGAVYSTIIPPKLITTALEGMKKAYDAGEKIVEVVQNAIDYISSELGTSWDSEKFRKEWEDKLGGKEKKTDLELIKGRLNREIESLNDQIKKGEKKRKEKKETELDEEAKSLIEKRDKLKDMFNEQFGEKEAKLKQLEKFRKKLKGLSDVEKDEVIRRSFKKLVENGALEYNDFKKIIADTLGYGELNPEQSKKIIDLVADINSVDELASKLRSTERNDKALKDYLAAKKKAERSATELGKIVFNKPDIINRLLSVMQLNTLGIPSLINNPIFNVFNQSTVRLPRSIVMTAIDYGIYGVGKLMGKNIKPENNVIAAQKEFYKKLALGTGQSVEQLFNGLTNKDYFQKEVYAAQIHPITSMKELWAFAKGKERMTGLQVADKTIQSTVGVPAEIIARVLNMGDKPQRFASEGAQAATFAKNLGLTNIDYKLFMEFPKEEAFRKLKKDGLSDADAMKKAEEIQERIIKEGEESTFQEDNILNDVINSAFEATKKYGKATHGVAMAAKTLNMPFVKIPLNAFWSVYNLANPEIALLQSAIYGAKALKTGSHIDIQQSKKWFAHAVTGLAWMGATAGLAKMGIINAANPQDATKKEREGEQYYEQQNSINVSKLMAYAQGKNPDDVKNGLNVDTKWFGNMGILMGYQASRMEKMTAEQKEASANLIEDMAYNLRYTAVDFMDKGVFANTGSLVTAINKGGSFMDSYLLNLVNMGTNIVQPAAFAQISRAQLPYYSKSKADSFAKEIKNNLLVRSSWLRELSGQYPPSKISIWGDRMDKKDNTIMRLFGMSTSNDDNFAQPIYEDYKETHNTKFFPSSIKPEIEVNGSRVKLNADETEQLETLIGQERKKLVAPYVNDMATFEGSSKKYSDLSDEEKISKLGILYSLGYESGKELFMKIHPEYKSSDTEEKKYKKQEQEEEDKSLREAKKQELNLN